MFGCFTSNVRFLDAVPYPPPVCQQPPVDANPDGRWIFKVPTLSPTFPLIAFSKFSLPLFQGLNLVYPWGAESGDSYGDGGAFDGDGVGNNASDETNYPYNANGARIGMPAAFV